MGWSYASVETRLSGPLASKQVRSFIDHGPRASVPADTSVKRRLMNLPSRIEDGSELPFLLLRANDWVATVRGFAIVAVRHRFLPGYFDHFARNAQLVLRLAECGRDKHDDIIQWFTGQLVGSQHEAVFLKIVQGANRWSSRVAFAGQSNIKAIIRTAPPALG